MGRLTDEMTRLVGEIVDMRGARKGFVKDLTNNTAALMANFHRAHKDMARKTKAERRAAVAHLMANFHRAHKDMARRTKAERRAAVAHLKNTVAADLDGARRAWAGK